MISATFDANVIASGFVRPGSVPDALLRAWLRRVFTLVVSEPIIGEVEHTLAKPYFAARLSPEQRAADIDVLRTAARITPIMVAVHGVATHPEDDLVLATAVSAQTEYLVTGDKKLQRLGAFRDVTIVSPRQYLEILNLDTDA